MTTETHPFERSFGPGPYRFVRLVVIHVGERGTAVSGRTDDVERGIGTCAHCSTPIMNCYVIQAGDGKKYAVGSDCIAKVNLPYEVKTEVERAKKAHERKLRQARAEIRREKDRVELLALSEKVREKLAVDPNLFKDRPHPNDYYTSQGKTFRDYVEYGIQWKSRFVVRRAADELQLGGKDV